MPGPQLEIVTGGAALAAVRELLRQYLAWMNVDLSFQDFDREVAELPGDYVAPAGTLLLARVQGAPAGCVAVRRFDEHAAELKRMFVREAFRGRGCGGLLAARAIAFAREAGYHRVLLDTLPFMSDAQAAYRRMGFAEIPPYRFNPIEGTKFMALELARTDS